MSRRWATGATSSTTDGRPWWSTHHARRGRSSGRRSRGGRDRRGRRHPCAQRLRERRARPGPQSRRRLPPLRPTRRSTSNGWAHGTATCPVRRLRRRGDRHPGHTRHHQSFLVRLPRAPGARRPLHRRQSPRRDRRSHGPGRPPAGPSRSPRRSGPASARSGRARSGTVVHPTHGFGSLCAAGTVPRPATAQPSATSSSPTPALTTDRETYVTDLVAGFGPVPGHYAHMAALNRSGAGSACPPAAATADEVDRRGPRRAPGCRPA